MGGIDWVVATMILGGTFHPIDGFDPERIIDVILDSPNPISWLYLVPGTIERLVDPELIREATETFDTPFQNTYGASETGHVTSGSNLSIGYNPSETYLSKIESPFVDVKLIDENWNEVENRGELTVRDPSLCSGYINAAETNEEDFHDGWFKTGEIFTRREDGTYDFISRQKYLIESGGENIYPTKLEDPIGKLPKV